VVVTIDGPSGAGKSTVSRMVAERLGFACLDTGALYRAVALAASLAGLAEERSPEVLAAWLTRVEMSARPENGRFVVRLDGGDVEPFIRNETIGGIASRLSAMAPVRGFLMDVQRRAAKHGDLVAEGRDMGTVVFPQAEAKFFLTASQEERARRRWLELGGESGPAGLEEIAREMATRDERDEGRALAPLKPAADAVVVDTTGLGVAQAVEALLAHLPAPAGGWRGI